MIDTIVQFLLDMIQSIGYGGVGLAMFIESFFAPIPSELIMPFAGFLAAQGKMNLWLVILVGWICSYLGSLPFYFLGYRGHRAKINQFVEKYGNYFFIKAEEVKRGFDLFHRYGNFFIFFGRLVPIVRTFVSFPAGAIRMNFWSFSALTILGSTAWSAFLAYSGYILGANRELVGWFMKQYEHLIIGVVIVCFLAFVGYKLLWPKYKK